MCGIVGATGYDFSSEEWENILYLSASTIAHRGPDDFGSWFDAKKRVGFAHQRLAVIDLSSKGHQPMFSRSRKFVITYNGEIYNYKKLREELEIQGANFISDSDTEVLLNGFEMWGVEKTIKKTVGMFAIALWNNSENVLYLIRDRLGKKPLYYGQTQSGLAFASELKALKLFPNISHTISIKALSLYLKLGYIPAPYTIFEGIKKLPPGSILKVIDNKIFPPQSYWSIHDSSKNFESTSFRGSFEEAQEIIESILQDAIKIRMIADVPLGAFLSGGIDSSLVVSIMQRINSDPIKTFTIGFAEAEYDEREYAKALANHLGTNHTEMVLSYQDAIDIIPSVPKIYDEPFADPSQIPTYLVSKIARKHVTVALSGDGGDELFAGYKHYKLANDIESICKHIPLPIRHNVSMYLPHFPNKFDFLTSFIKPLFMRYGRTGKLSDKLQKLSALLDYETPKDLYFRMISHWGNISELLYNYHPNILENLHWPTSSSFLSEMMLFDLAVCLPDDILVKVDRASMAENLEVRAPLLDHRLVEFVWELPIEFIYSQKQEKMLLKKILGKYIPLKIVEHPKTGFGIPIADWIRAPLRDWAESLLDETRIIQEGYFNPATIRQKWHEHLSGKRNWIRQLWDVLMFQAWYENYFKLNL